MVFVVVLELIIVGVITTTLLREGGRERRNGIKERGYGGTQIDRYERKRIERGNRGRERSGYIGKEGRIKTKAQWMGEGQVWKFLALVIMRDGGVGDNSSGNGGSGDIVAHGVPWRW